MLIIQVRFLGIFAALNFCFGGIISAAAQGAGGASVINPGEGIGQIHLGEKLEDVHTSLGTPKLGNASMGGKLWEVWRSGPAFEGKRQNGLEELEVYFMREGTELSPVVRQIRVTSPFFQTISGISIRNSYAEIIKSFSNLRRDEELTYALNGGRSEKEFEIFVDRVRGIAFEFRNGASADPGATGYCRAIHVFRPNTDPRSMQAFDQQSEVQ